MRLLLKLMLPLWLTGNVSYVAMTTDVSLTGYIILLALIWALYIDGYLTGKKENEHRSTH